MRHTLLITFTLFLFAAVANGQPFLNETSYLNNPKISREAKLFYTKKIKPGDDENTNHVIDSLKTKNDGTRPFYIMVVSRMFEGKDGALGEELIIISDRFFTKHPNELLEFLYAANGSGKQYGYDWAQSIADAFEMQWEEKSRAHFAKAKPQIRMQVKQQNLANFEDFYIRTYNLLPK